MLSQYTIWPLPAAYAVKRTRAVVPMCVMRRTTAWSAPTARARSDASAGDGSRPVGSPASSTVYAPERER
jgi:hypothetical protein